MFGTTYPMFGFETTLSERLRDPALAEYIRWEYRPADQARIVLSVLGGSTTRSARRYRGPRRRGWLGHLRDWHLRDWIASRRPGRAAPSRP
ncbi:MAG TPA: hypothetical protein VEO96_10285 [Thermoplasmata archaeon]|nr:hypothetical protein [Thermoplasmata archaeon]